MRDPATPMITLATAHPAKFPDAVKPPLAVRPPLPGTHGDLFDRERTRDPRVAERFLRRL